MLGQDGVERLSEYIFQEEQAKAEAKKSPAQYGQAMQDRVDAVAASFHPPDWLKQWRKHHLGQPWGFVVFRTALYGGSVDENVWQAFQQRFDAVINMSFLPVSQGNGESKLPRDFAEAREGFEIRWIQKKDLADASADDLRAEYSTIKADLPPGLAHPLFLCASPGAVESFLSVPDAELPKPTSKRWRADAPFLLAVAVDPDPGLEDGHEERQWFKPVFKVAAETLVDELWSLLDADIMPVRRLTRNIKSSDELGGLQSASTSHDDLEDIWWTMAPSPGRMEKRRRIASSD